MAGLLSLRNATLALPGVTVRGLAGFEALASAVISQWLASYSDKVAPLHAQAPPPPSLYVLFLCPVAHQTTSPPAVLCSHQLPGLLSGLPLVRPVSSVVRAGSMVVRQPVANFPRVLQGLRQGFAGSLTVAIASVSLTLKTTTVEFCNVTSALFLMTQRALETTQCVPPRHTNWQLL
jgi:hypothetical protein